MACDIASVDGNRRLVPARAHTCAEARLRRLCRLPTIFMLLALSSCAVLEQQATQSPEVHIDGAHPGASTRVEFDPEGSRIATGGYSGEIRIWDVPSGDPLQTLEAHTDTVRGLVWMEKQVLVSAADDGRIIAWNLDAGRPEVSVATSRVTALAAIPRRRELVTGHGDGQLRLWSYPGLALRGEYRLGGRVVSVAARPDGDQLAAANTREEVAVFNSELNLLRYLPTEGKNAQELRYSPDGRQLAAGTWFDLYFWDLETGTLTVKDTEHIGAIISVDYTPDGRHLVSLGRHTDSKIRLLDLESGRLARRLDSHELCGYSVRIGPRGRYVATVSDDESVRLYDISAPYQPTRRYPVTQLP